MPSYIVLFRGPGRFFQIHVYIGKQAGRRYEQRRCVSLDSFRAKTDLDVSNVEAIAWAGDAGMSLERLKAGPWAA